MKIFVIDKSLEDLDRLCREAEIAFPGSLCHRFTDPLLAVKSYSADPPDFTVFSCSMRIIDGFMFTTMIRKIDPSFTGLMIEEDDRWRENAGNYALDYQVKPVSARMLRDSWEKISMHSCL